MNEACVCKILLNPTPELRFNNSNKFPKFKFDLRLTVSSIDDDYGNIQ